MCKPFSGVLDSQYQGKIQGILPFWLVRCRDKWRFTNLLRKLNSIRSESKQGTIRDSSRIEAGFFGADGLESTANVLECQQDQFLTGNESM